MEVRAIVLSNGECLRTVMTFDEIYDSIGDGFYLAEEEDINRLVEDEPEIIN